MGKWNRYWVKNFPTKDKPYDLNILVVFRAWERDIPGHQVKLTLTKSVTTQDPVDKVRVIWPHLIDKAYLVIQRCTVIGNVWSTLIGIGSAIWWR